MGLGRRVWSGLVLFNAIIRLQSEQPYIKILMQEEAASNLLSIFVYLSISLASRYQLDTLDKHNEIPHSICSPVYLTLFFSFLSFFL